jgi:hypothetical protein
MARTSRKGQRALFAASNAFQKGTRIRLFSFDLISDRSASNDGLNEIMIKFRDA